MEKPFIQLSDFRGVGLIVSYPSGVYYTNQTGGYACMWPVLEGVFAPLTNPVLDQSTKLNGFFIGSKWEGRCDEGIDEETADFIDSVLIESNQTKILRVNRDKLADSHEAWIHVVILKGRESAELQQFYGSAGEIGVLTWENSD